MGEFDRNHLPDPVTFFEGEGVPLKGRGPWRTGPCPLHGGSDSLRVKVDSGAWRCMACGAKGGDVLAFAMQRHCLDFVEAARSLGAYVDDGKPHRGQRRPNTVSTRDAMELAALEMLIALVVISDIQRGLIPNELDWHRFLVSAGRVQELADEYRT